MIEPTTAIYQELLKQFYRKALKSHPNRHDLAAKLIKRMSSVNQQKYLEVQALKPGSPRSNTSNRSGSNYLDVQISKSKSGSSRQIQPQSPTLYKKHSDQKSSLSGDSNLSKQQKRNRQQEKYFNSQWVYKSNSLKKTICYALIYVYFQTNDLYNFTRVNDNIEIYMNENDIYDKEIITGINEWGKLQQTFSKKDKVRWTKILPEIFVNFNSSFINLIFEFMTRIKQQSSQDYKTLTKQSAQTISKYVKISINYFEIFHQEIEKSLEKVGNFKIEINIGYIREQDTYIFASRFPQKSQVETKKQKVIKNISQSIANLLRQYDSNTQKLLSLDILSETSIKQTGAKNYLSKKDLFK